ncbi:hypothetical protein Shyhy02_23010 [Streptomyces hygroscopicus subsp. hygroscopicus]|nr:hypothetical protein Shyhy02_23010 [Streptomyces hygroscopicus subsp. hygroscopicus]
MSGTSAYRCPGSVRTGVQDRRLSVSVTPAVAGVTDRRAPVLRGLADTGGLHGNAGVIDRHHPHGTVIRKDVKSAGPAPAGRRRTCRSRRRARRVGLDRAVPRVNHSTEC